MLKKLIPLVFCLAWALTGNSCLAANGTTGRFPAASSTLLAEANHSAVVAGHATNEQPHEASFFDINYKILLSQIFNFCLLLLVLTKFMFRPIREVLAERDRSIGQTRAITEEESKKAKELRNNLEKRLKEIEREAYEIRQKAVAEAQGSARQILKNARDKAKLIEEKADMRLFLERQKAWAHLREQVLKLTILAAEKVIETNLDDEAQHKLIKSTIEKLEETIAENYRK